VSVVEPGSAGERLLVRVRAILFRPAGTWEVIAEEPAAGRELFRSYVVPLAAIPAVCGFVGMLLFGYSIAGIGFQANVPTAAIEATVDFTLTLATVFLVAVAIDLLAPAFGGIRSAGQALKLAAYSGTALWVAGVFSLYPSFGILAGVLGGLYSLYTLNLGLPKLMRVPQDNALSYFATVLGAILVIGALQKFLVGRASELGGPLRTAALALGLA
jgi:hypothetical protein